jgi:ERF superfamily
MTTRAKKEEVVPQANSLNIYQKLHLAKQSMGKVIKNATNPHLKRNYADINSIIDTVEPILLDHGLLLIQPVKDDKVYTIVVDIENGDRFESFMTLPPITDAQKLGGAITYFRRYTLVSLLSLQAVDDDGHDASRAPKAKPTITEDRFSKALAAIHDGRYTVEDLRATYSLTKEQEGQL